MHFFNTTQYFQFILALATLQLMIILLWGKLVKIYIRKNHAYPTSYYQLFEREDYNPCSSYDTPKYPQYSFVVVKFNNNKTIKSETFYTNLGDWVYFEYKNKQRIKNKATLISNYFLIIFLFLILSLVFAANVLSMANLFVEIDKVFLANFFKITKKITLISFVSTAITLFSKPSFE